MSLTVTTTGSIEGRTIESYLGVAAGETILGVNVFKDIAAGFRNIVGGRSGKYEEELRKGRDTAIEEMAERAREMGADAVVGVKVDYETVGGQMLMITACGTAVKLR
ncbi:MAG: YbjQ family protein [Thermoflexaceae bacterium]|nr:YbjQ family protein [Thermoflexaceae bacterium]